MNEHLLSISQSLIEDPRPSQITYGLTVSISSPHSAEFYEDTTSQATVRHPYYEAFHNAWYGNCLGFCANYVQHISLVKFHLESPLLLLPRILADTSLLSDTFENNFMVTSQC